MPVLGNMFASDSKLNYLSVLSTSSPHIHLYPWVRGVGIGTKFSNPATAITGAVSNSRFNASFSSGSRYILAITNTSPYLQIYAVTNSGFGTKVSNPATTPPSTISAHFSPSNTDIVVFESGGTGRTHSYSWTGSAFGSKSANISTSLSSLGYNMGSAQVGEISTSGKTVGMGFNGNNGGSGTSLFMTQFDEGIGVGTRYSDPADSRVLQVNTYGITWNPQGDIYVMSGVSPYLRAVNWSDSSGFGTLINSLGGNESFRGSFNQIGNFFLAVNSTIYSGSLSYFIFTIAAFSSSGFGTIIARPFFTIPSFPDTNAYNGEFSPYGTEFVFSTNLSNSIYAYPFTGSSVGTKYSDPATLPGGTVVDTRFG